MRLKSFQVRVFRNIVDSGEITVDEAVTCLVGKNEAGKSAMLQALHHLNPAKPKVALSLLDEYPRWLKKEHEISGEIASAVPITATFELHPDEVAEFDQTYGTGVLQSNDITFSRAYSAPQTLDVGVQIDYSKFVDPFIADLPERLKVKLGRPATSDALIKALDLVVSNREEAEPGTVTLATDASDARVKLTESLGGKSNLRSAIDDRLRSLVPCTFYFSSYSQLQGRYNIVDVFPALQNGSDDETIQAAADFLKLARIAPSTIEAWDFESSNAELESISSLLTKRVKEHWHQNDHLKLRVSLEIQKATPQETVQRYLQFRVEDTRHDFSSRLDRRSTGFQWFISFIASFLEFESTQNLILLLDEPGLSLHARAQMDLLDTIETRLATKRQVLYTTHSPFLVRINRLDRARITEDQGPSTGSVVMNDAGKVTDRDTLFPLQAALGYDVAQSIFIGNQNVLLEGVSDFLYITALSDHLEAGGRHQLSPTARLLPAGGATNIPTFIALLGGQLDIVVVLDGGTDQQRVETAITSGRLKASKVLSLDRFSPVSRADIEDLFEPAEYLALYNGAFSEELKLADLTGKDRIVKRIERRRGSEFNHGLVAAYFLRNLQESLASLSDVTVARFEELLKAINDALPT